MKFSVIADTDIGNVKSTNQDSVCVKVASSCHGDVLFAMVCDGMGGLAKGELASATVVSAFVDWFEKEYSQAKITDWQQVSERWDELIKELNAFIGKYGKLTHLELGTTLTVMLIADGNYIIGHVGDSRAYVLNSDKIEMLTVDQTLVAREIELGRLTPEQAKTDPRRNILLQCVGASPVVMPSFEFGKVEPNSVYVLCSDGFRHEISSDEIRMSLYGASNENDMQTAARGLIDTCMQRGERDNISVIVIRTGC